MEIHAFVPPVARTGVVPAALFFGLALKFPPTLSIPAILCVDAWLAAVPGPIEKEIFYTSAMALVAGGAGIAVRGGYRKRRPGGERRAGGDRPEPGAGSSLGGFGKRRSSRKRRDDRGIQPAPEGRGTEGWDPAGAGSPVGADRRFPCRLRRPVRIPRIRPPRRVPAEPRLAGLPGDLPSRHVCPRSGGDRFQETVSRGRAGCEAVRPVEKRSWERPRRGRRRPGLQGGGGGRRSPRGPRRGGPMEGSRDPGDGTGGSFRRARYRADAGTAPGGPVLSPRGVVPQHGPEDGGGGDGRGSGAGRRRAFEAGDGLRGDRGTGPPAGRRGQGPSGRIRARTRGTVASSGRCRRTGADRGRRGTSLSGTVTSGG